VGNHIDSDSKDIIVAGGPSSKFFADEYENVVLDGEHSLRQTGAGKRSFKDDTARRNGFTKETFVEVVRSQPSTFWRGEGKMIFE
jgi:hypothetical protein